MDSQLVLMLAAGTLLLLNGLIARGVNPDAASSETISSDRITSETMPPPESRERENEQPFI